jgi:DNA polymerase III subunit epsilon
LTLWRSPPWDSVVYWSLDLETGGLDSRKDPILAVGMVPIRQGVIRLGESFRSLVRPPAPSTISHASITAHQLIWNEVREAPEVAAVLREVDSRLREGVLLVHHASIDVTFLRRAYRREGMRWPRPRVVDTAQLILKAARHARFTSPEHAELPSLNLAVARRDAGLPEYQAHDALGDAVATAELLLVLRRRLGARRLRDLA